MRGPIQDFTGQLEALKAAGGSARGQIAPNWAS